MILVLSNINIEEMGNILDLWYFRWVFESESHVQLFVTS